MASPCGYHDASSSGFGILSSELGAIDLPSKRLLGTGLASVGYETELNGKKYARKDFMGVPSSTFKREANRLVGLKDHANLVKTLDWTKNNMSCSLVLEYMDDDLLGFLQKRKQSQGSMEAGPNSGNQSDLDSRNTIKLAPFKLPEALGLMLQIARGMEYLADKGIRHGNLKTKNVLVTHTDDPDGKSLSVKVSDFGLVRTRRKSTSFASRQARKLDMARWTAPELLQVFLLEDKGETSSESDSDEDCTHFSDVPEWRELGGDVYSFAVTCSQILTGEDPFPYPNLNWKELGVNILRHGLTPKLPASCPPKLRELLVSCWGFDHLYLDLRERPSFSYIRMSLERLQQLDFSNEWISTRYFQECLPVPEKVPMDMKRKDQLRQPTPGKEPTDVVREIGLREPVTVEDLRGDPRGSEWLSEKVPMDMMDLKRKDQLREPMFRKEPMDVKNEIVMWELERASEAQDLEAQLEALGLDELVTMDDHDPCGSKWLPEKVLMDMKRKDQLRQPMFGKETADVEQDVKRLRESVSVEDPWGSDSEWESRRGFERLSEKVLVPVEDRWGFERLPQKVLMDMRERKDQLLQSMPGEEPTDVKQEIGVLELERAALLDMKRKYQLKPMSWKEPTVGLQERVIVEDLWGTEWLRHSSWRLRGPLVEANFFSMAKFFSMYLQILTFDVASLIMRTRTVVRYRIEWTQLREELELIVPDLLRIRNQWVGYEKTLSVERLFDLWRTSPVDAWSTRLTLAVRNTLREVGEQQQENDRSLPPSWLTEPWRVSRLRNDFNELAKKRKEILLDLTLSLREAYLHGARARANEQAKRRPSIE